MMPQFDSQDIVGVHPMFTAAFGYSARNAKDRKVLIHPEASTIKLKKKDPNTIKITSESLEHNFKDYD